MENQPKCTNKKRIKHDDFHIKYKLERKNPLGKGSFSTVYLATDKFNNQFAVKQISLSKIRSEHGDKFQRELDISMRLNHPNIVKCIEIFKTEYHWYIVTEYCDGGTLQNLLPTLSKYNNNRREEIVKKILSELKDALKYLISNNIIHRDLKPQNILIKKLTKNNYTIKLADFGFARYFSNKLTDDGHDDMVSTICGSPIYMAPEILIDLKSNTKADLWSFGVIMYELLYGNNPYYFPKNIPELRKLIVEKQITYNHIFTQDCMDLLKSLLIIDPKNRISWKNLFLHKWFITNYEVKSNIKSNNNIKNKSRRKSIIRSDSEIAIFPLEIVSSGDILKKEISQINIHNEIKSEDTLNDTDFEIINIDDINNQQIDYNSYHESSTNSLINILSYSLKSIWNYGSNPSSPSSFGTSPIITPPIDRHNITNTDNINNEIKSNLPYGKSSPIDINK